MRGYLNYLYKEALTDGGNQSVHFSYMVSALSKIKKKLHQN
jgi:hypothetical protein